MREESQELVRESLENEEYDESQIGRPVLITLASVVMLLLIAYDLLFLLYIAGLADARADFVQDYGNAALIIVPLFVVLGTIGTIGYWRARKWGVYFLTLAFINTFGGFAIFSDIVSIDPFQIINLVIVGIGLLYFRRLK